MGFIASALLAATLLVSGCKPHNDQTAEQKAAYAAAQQQAAAQQAAVQQPAPTIYQPPIDQLDPSLANNPNPVVSTQPVVEADYAAYGVTLSDNSCPVAPSSLQRVLQGWYGVDMLGRPINGALMPVDRMGYCVSTPVPQSEIRNVAISPYYVGYLSQRYGYAYQYNPGWHYNYGPSFVYYSGPVVAFHHVTTYTPAHGTVVTKEVIQQHTVVNSGAGVRLPGKGSAAPASQGVRLPGKDQPAAAPAAAPGNTGFNFNKQPAAPAATPAATPAPAAAPPAKTGFTFNKQPAAAPAAAPAAPAAKPSGFNFSKPAASPSSSKPSGFSFKSSGGSSRRH
jgi:hypothetical protein